MDPEFCKFKACGRCAWGTLYGEDHMAYGQRYSTASLNPWPSGMIKMINRNRPSFCQWPLGTWNDQYMINRNQPESFSWRENFSDRTMQSKFEISLSAEWKDSEFRSAFTHVSWKVMSLCSFFVLLYVWDGVCCSSPSTRRSDRDMRPPSSMFIYIRVEILGRVCGELYLMKTTWVVGFRTPFLNYKDKWMDGWMDG